MARRKSATTDTRGRILAAACDEFGAHGFAATSVDRIAKRARVNKAMIYYHFSNKRALYACILQGVFGSITQRLRAVTAGPAPPAQKLDHLIDALVRAVDQSTHFLPIFLREIADGGVHLGPEELAHIAGIFGTVRSVITEGVAVHAFQPAHPALSHFTIVAPLLMFRATAPVRARIRGLGQVDIPDADSDAVAGHLKMVARRMLAAPPPDADRAAGERRRAQGAKR